MPETTPDLIAFIWAMGFVPAFITAFLIVRKDPTLNTVSSLGLSWLCMALWPVTLVVISAFWWHKNRREIGNFTRRVFTGKGT